MTSRRVLIVACGLLLLIQGCGYFERTKPSVILNEGDFMPKDNIEPPWMAELRKFAKEHEKEKLTGNVLPPWEKFPNVPRASIGWRMGPGQDYAYEFRNWFRQLSDVGRSEYRARWPEPQEWVGYLDFLENSP